MSEVRVSLTEESCHELIATAVTSSSFKFQVSSLFRKIEKNTKYDVPLLAVSYGYSRRAVA